MRLKQGCISLPVARISLTYNHGRTQKVFRGRVGAKLILLPSHLSSTPFILGCFCDTGLLSGGAFVRGLMNELSMEDRL